jgi:hypothetical protein
MHPMHCRANGRKLGRLAPFMASVTIKGPFPPILQPLSLSLLRGWPFYYRPVCDPVSNVRQWRLKINPNQK